MNRKRKASRYILLDGGNFRIIIYNIGRSLHFSRYVLRYSMKSFLEILAIKWAGHDNTYRTSDLRREIGIYVLLANK